MTSSLFILLIAICIGVSDARIKSLSLLEPGSWNSLDEYSNIDMLREVYLKLEQAIWSTINSGIAEMLTIHDIHVTFFSENFNEKGMPLDDVDFDHQKLNDTIQQINQIVIVLNSQYQNDYNKSFAFDRLEKTYTSYLDITHNITSNITQAMDLFASVANVSYNKKIGHLKHNNSSYIHTDSSKLPYRAACHQ